MSFPAYDSYQESEVQWLGHVPSSWSVIPLKRIAKLTTGMTPPTADEDNYSEEPSFGWVRPEDLDESGEPTKATKFLSAKGWVLARQIPPYSSLVCCIGTIGKTGFVKEEVSTNQQITAATFGQDQRYYFYALTAARTELEVSSTGNVVRILNTERLGEIDFPLPPPDEQKAISSFLDMETSKIDGLVSEQRRLIELLKEKRQAVISHAVTKGLNPNAPMKPSGIQWLGDVPEHWEVMKLGRVTKDRCDGPFGSGLKSSHYADEGIRVVRLNNIRHNRFDDSDAAFIDPDHYNGELGGGHDVIAGDLLIAGLGDAKNAVGRACVAPDGIEPAMVKADCFRYRVNKERVLTSFMSAQLTIGAPTDAGRMSTGTTRSRTGPTHTNSLVSQGLARGSSCSSPPFGDAWRCFLCRQLVLAG